MKMEADDEEEAEEGEVGPLVLLVGSALDGGHDPFAEQAKADPADEDDAHLSTINQSWMSPTK